jgi:dienelactone hydrolase
VERCSSTPACRSPSSRSRGRAAYRSRCTAWTPTPPFVDEGDIEAARDLVASADDAELFLYPGNGHLFTDSSLEAYDADATALLMERVLAFLDTV